MKKYMSLCLVLLLCVLPYMARAEETEKPEVKSVVIEYENYQEAFQLKSSLINKTNAPANTASGGAFLHWDTGYEQEDLTGDISFTIPESGLYRVRLVASRLSSCVPAILIDGTNAPASPEVTALDKAGEDGVYPYFARKFFGAYQQDYVMYIQAGQHVLTTNIPRRTFKENGSEMRDVAACLDCVTFTPTDSVPVSTETVLEYEHFNNFKIQAGKIYNQTSRPGNLSSGGAFLYWDTGSLEEDLRNEIPVYVEKTGFYELTVVGYGVSCPIRIYQDGTQVLNSSLGGTLVDELDENGVSKYFCISPYKAHAFTASVHLTAGYHLLETVLVRRTLQYDGWVETDVAACIDSLSLSYTETPVVSVAAQGTTVGEFENYTQFTVLDGFAKRKGDVGEYEKGTVMRFTEITAEDGMKIYIPVVAEEAGWYRLDSIIHSRLSEWTSLVDLSINGETVLQNTDKYMIEDLSKAEDGTIDYISTSYPMKKFQGFCYLPQGESTMVYYAKKRVGQTASDSVNGVYRVCTIADNFVFTRLNDTVTLNGNTAAVNAYFDEAQHGTMISAAYKNGFMVGLRFDRMNGEGKLETEISCTQRPDTVKIMVWDNFFDMEPSVRTKVIEIK